MTHFFKIREDLEPDLPRVVGGLLGFQVLMKPKELDRFYRHLKGGRHGNSQFWWVYQVENELVVHPMTPQHQ